MYFVLIIVILIVVTMKQTFSIINIIKKKIHNYMKNDILTDFSILYIKRKIVTKFHTEKWYKGTSNSILIYQTPICIFISFVYFFYFLFLNDQRIFVQVLVSPNKFMVSSPPVGIFAKDCYYLVVLGVILLFFSLIIKATKHRTG